MNYYKISLLLTACALSSLNGMQLSDSGYSEDATHSLVTAAKNGDFGIAEQSLKGKADPNGTFIPKYGHAHEPLRAAVDKNDLKLYGLLCRYGVSKQWPMGSPEYTAAIQGHADICRALLNDGAELENVEQALKFAKAVGRKEPGHPAIQVLIAEFKSNHPKL